MNGSFYASRAIVVSAITGAGKIEGVAAERTAGDEVKPNLAGNGPDANGELTSLRGIISCTEKN
jgi:hypothetical protein